MNPRNVVPESNMPAYPWLADHEVDGRTTVERMLALRALGHPYTDEQIAGAEKAVAGATELEALIAYLQGLGTNIQARR
jgi:cytochrome c oxidase cbb3-type subunit 2